MFFLHKLNKINNNGPKVNVKKDKKVRKIISVQIMQEIIEKHKKGIDTSALVSASTGQI